MTDLKPGGGFVFATVHNVQRDVPPENVVACFDAAMEYGWYSGDAGEDQRREDRADTTDYEKLESLRSETGLGAL